MALAPKRGPIRPATPKKNRVSFNDPETTSSLKPIMSLYPPKCRVPAYREGLLGKQSPTSSPCAILPRALFCAHCTDRRRLR